MSKATFYEHFANKEECILALFDEAATEVMRAMVGGVRRRGPRLLRGARGRRRARLPGDARLLSRPRRRRCSCRSSAPDPRAAARRDAILDAFAESLYRDNQRAAPQYGAPHLRLARRRLRDHRRLGRARLAQPAHRPAGGRARARAGDHPADAGRARSRRVTRPGLARDRSARSSPAGAARGWSPGASRWRARSARRSPTRSTGVARCPASATRPRACSSSAWRPPPTAATAPAACSPATARATGCSPRMHRAGFANQPTSVHRDDGLRLHDAWIAAAVRCAPPANKPTPAGARRVPAVDGGRARARSPTCASSSASARSRGTRRCGCAPRSAIRRPRPRPRFGHEAVFDDGAWLALLGCFHPSQQNTFTGRADRADARRGRLRALPRDARRGRCTPSVRPDAHARLRAAPLLARRSAAFRTRTRVHRATLDGGLPLSSFTPAVRDWFERAFAAPTPAQEQAWPAIATGEHVLISAPTGTARRWPRSCGASTGSPREPRRRHDAPGLRLAAEGARLRRRAQPARAAARHRRRPLGRDPHRRHAAARARCDAPHAAGHPDHDARVAVPDPHLAGARDAARRRVGDRRRDPRRRLDQARRAPRAHARAPRRARATTSPSASA